MYQEPKFEGTLRIHLVHCKDLPKTDLFSGQSDPYVEFSLTGPLKLKRKSKVIKNTRNPIFNQFIDLEVKGLKDSQLEQLNLIIKVFDEDTGNLDDLVGTAKIDNVQDLFYNKGKWALNKILSLENCADQRAQIYLQITFFDQNFDNNLPPLLEDLQSSLSSYEKKGFLYLDVFHAKGLPKVDNQQLIDPYVKIFFLGKEKNLEFKTKTLKKTNCPQFNQNFSQELDIKDFRNFETGRIQLYNDDSLICEDQLIGEYVISKSFFEDLFE